jgi:hypothetical protein
VRNRDLRGKFPAGFPAGNPPGREQEVRGDPAGREMLSREYRGEGFNLEGNPAGKFVNLIFFKFVKYLQWSVVND